MNDSVYEAVAVVSIVDLNKPPVLMLGVDTVNTMIAYTDGQVSPIVIAPELGITGIVYAKLLHSALLFNCGYFSY